MTSQEELTKGLRKAFASQLSTGQFHDFVVHCKDEHEFKLHRIIVAAQSDFFKAAVGSNFAEGVSQTMNLFDDDPALIARMLAFMYTGEYCEDSLTTTPSGLQLEPFHSVRDSFAKPDMNWCDKSLLHCHLFALADKYAIRNLRTEAFWRFTRSYYDDDPPTDGSGHESQGENENEGEDEGEGEGEGEGENDGHRFTDLELEQFSCIIRAVYASTPANVRELRRLVVRHIYVSAGYRMFDSSAMRAVLSEVSDFASDLAMAHHAAPTTLACICGVCGEIWSNPVIGLCACGIVGPCEAARCQQKWVRESICIGCYTVGRLSYPGPPEADDGTLESLL